jgi:hypothetical protein
MPVTVPSRPRRGHKAIKPWINKIFLFAFKSIIEIFLSLILFINHSLEVLIL